LKCYNVDGWGYGEDWVGLAREWHDSQRRSDRLSAVVICEVSGRDRRPITVMGINDGLVELFVPAADFRCVQCMSLTQSTSVSLHKSHPECRRTASHDW